MPFFKRALDFVDWSIDKFNRLIGVENDAAKFTQELQKEQKLPNADIIGQRKIVDKPKGSTKYVLYEEELAAILLTPWAKDRKVMLNQKIQYVDIFFLELYSWNTKNVVNWVYYFFHFAMKINRRHRLTRKKDRIE